jgi:hypothetical protein
MDSFPVLQLMDREELERIAQDPDQTEKRELIANLLRLLKRLQRPWMRKAEHPMDSQPVARSRMADGIGGLA